MSAPYPRDFREGAVRVSGKREARQNLATIAKHFRISEPCLTNRMRQADVEVGARPGSAREESSELRDARMRSRLLDQEDEVPSSGGGHAAVKASARGTKKHRF